MNGPRSSDAGSRSLLVLGGATVVAQATLLREAMAALGGSELAWGSVLALWLAATAVGARVGAARGSDGLARLCPMLVLAAAAAGVVLLRAGPAMTGATAGELVTTGSALWLWVAAVAPAGCCGGLAFPILAAGAGASRAYALEAVGSVAGGLAFTFVLAPLGTAAILTVAIGVVGGLQLWPARRVPALLLLSAGVAAAPGAGILLAEAGWHWSRHPGELRRWKETRHQRLELAGQDPLHLYADGRLAATYPDPWQVVPRAHLLMLLHPEPRHVLLVGGLADGTLEPLLRHPIASALVVEDDPALPRLVQRWYPMDFATALADRRVGIAAAGPLRTLDRGGPWDLVLLLDDPPTTLRRNRTRTEEFFVACARTMTPSGVLVVRSGVPDTYLGGGGGELLGILASTLRRSFPAVRAIAGEEVLLVAAREPASLELDPAALDDRWHRRSVSDPRFDPRILPVLLDPARSADVDAFLATGSSPPNTVARPRAVLLAAGLEEGRSRGRLLTVARWLELHRPLPLAAATAAIAVLFALLPLTPCRTGAPVAAVVGLGSISWVLLLLGGWQARHGSVYSEIGALEAAFMGGLCGGALWATRWRRSERVLPWLLVGSAVLSAAIAFSSPAGFPLATIPLMLVAGGALTGGSFAGVARLTGSPTRRRRAGVAFTADELGAAIGSLLVGLLAIPWAGMTATALGLAVVQIAAIPAARKG